MRLSKDVVDNLMSRHIMMTLLYWGCLQVFLCDVVDDLWLRWRCCSARCDDRSVFLDVLLDAQHSNMKLRFSMFNVAAWGGRRWCRLFLSLMSSSSGSWNWWKLLDVTLTGCGQQCVCVLDGEGCMAYKGSMFSDVIPQVLNKFLMMSSWWWLLIDVW